MFSIKYFTGCIIASVLLVSCSKEERFDVEGDPTVKIFLNNEALGNAPQNSISFSAVNHPNPSGAGVINLSTNIPDIIKIPVFATREVGNTVEVSVLHDNALVAQYNTANNTNYQAFPEGFLNTSNLKATIQQGKFVSGDSITIPVNKANIGILTAPAYLAPLKLQTVSNNAGQISNNTALQVAYVVVNVELRQIRFLTGASDAVGTLAAGRNSWSVSYTPSPDLSSGSIFDGSTNTFARWGTAVTSPVIDVMMPESKNITGIRIHTSTSSTTSPTQVQVQLSNDGINYDIIGTPLRANLTYQSGYTYIHFYKAITAKYVRLIPTYSTSTNTQNKRLTEFDVYTID